MSSEISWIAAVAFVALTGMVGLAEAASMASHSSTRRLLIVGTSVALPTALLAGWLFTS